MTYAVDNGLVGDEVEIIIEAELIREFRLDSEHLTVRSGSCLLCRPRFSLSTRRWLAESPSLAITCLMCLFFELRGFFFYAHVDGRGETERDKGDN